jgi:hypothetical protein
MVGGWCRGKSRKVKIVYGKYVRKTMRTSTRFFGCGKYGQAKCLNGRSSTFTLFLKIVNLDLLVQVL